MSAISLRSGPLLLVLVALILSPAALAAPQSTVQRWTMKSSFAGSPSFVRGGSGLGVRSSFNRAGQAPTNTFGGGSSGGFNTFNPLGSFFNTQLQNIQNSFSRGPSIGSSSSSFPSRGSSFPSRGSSSSVRRPTSGSSRVSSSSVRRPSSSSSSGDSDD